MKNFWTWFKSHFDLHSIFTPIALVNVKIQITPYSYSGFTRVYVFGVRIAVIQRNNPWEN